MKNIKTMTPDEELQAVLRLSANESGIEMNESEIYNAAQEESQSVRKTKNRKKKIILDSTSLGFSYKAYTPPTSTTIFRPSHSTSHNIDTKQHFIQANFRCFLKKDTDVSKVLWDPDCIIDWCLIERMEMLCSELMTCPICLEFDIVAGRITRCGHVFCLPCIIRYVENARNRQSRTCPLCLEAVSLNDLKPVTFQMLGPSCEAQWSFFFLSGSLSTRKFSRSVTKIQICSSE
eukprot:GHVL01022332.1.p1 GENE.GHVL01022332.1~~GHVL01022332.1.p1  ORF type:complete len:233 (+),score=30.36 GHVL01022332.1:127-825(+)